MKEKNTAKRLFSVLWIYLLCAALTAILIPLPQKESSGELWRQYEARLDTPAAQERVMTIEDSDSALLLRLQLIESARRELIFSTFDLRADESGQSDDGTAEQPQECLTTFPVIISFAFLLRLIIYFISVEVQPSAIPDSRLLISLSISFSLPDKLIS